MSDQEYLTRMKQIQESFLNYIDNESNSETNFKDLEDRFQINSSFNF